MRILGADDVRGRVPVLDDRHLTNAIARLHRGQRRRLWRPHVHIEAPGQDNEDVLVGFARRQQDLALGDISPIAALQQFVDVIGSDAPKELEAVEQRRLVVGIFAEWLLHPHIVTGIAPA